MKRPDAAWEWMAGAVGMVAVAGSLGFIVVEGLTETREPPAFDVVVDTVQFGNGRYAALFTIHNTGQTTGAEVTVRAILRRDGQVVDSAETTFDYVPAESSRTGGFLFKVDPRPLDLEIGAISWTTP